jgi:hypothetical protein
VSPATSYSTIASYYQKPPEYSSPSVQGIHLQVLRIFAELNQDSLYSHPHEATHPASNTQLLFGILLFKLKKINLSHEGMHLADKEIGTLGSQNTELGAELYFHH